MGVAARGSFDLDQHAAHSGKSMEYTEVPTGAAAAAEVSRKYVPHVIEPSIGLDR
jgi:glycyl-tRNA synthetase